MNQAQEIKDGIATIVERHARQQRRSIGAPNSVARYLSERNFGENKWIVLERVNGDLELRAAQKTHGGAYREWMKNPQSLLMVDVVNCWIVYDERNAAGAIAYAESNPQPARR